MKRLTKFFLALTIAGFALGFLFVTDVINVGNAVGWYMTMPAGAIFFGLFLISLMLEKEVVKFENEQRTHPASPTRAEPTDTADAGTRRDYSLKHAH